MSRYLASPAAGKNFRHALHKAQHFAQNCYLRYGRVPARLAEVINAALSYDATRKYSPDQPRDDHGRWTSEGDAGVSTQSGASPKQAESSVKTLEDAQKLVEDSRGHYIGKNSQCASLTHALSPELPATSMWFPDEHVQGNTDIPIGTPVATFNYQGKPGTNGYGPADSQGGLSGMSHTGIYLGQNDMGMQLLSQWTGSKGPSINTIPWDEWGKNPNEGGARYYTIKY